ncbi:T9SS type A sorting domain-containing protein [candidate division KSB1 bacterium]|nr:T9SS type A sorting domain-containing protein [candidate division KSB1 bacterium]
MVCLTLTKYGVTVKRLVFVILLISSSISFASEYHVSNAKEIERIMNTAQPGDTLTMVAGVWTDQLIDFHGNGAKGDSIVLRAEKPGHVFLNGRSNLSIGGTYLKVDGLRFVGGYNGSSAITFDNDSQHCRVTNTMVSEFNPPNATIRYHWIKINGSHHRLDHCYFSGQRHSGVTVHVSLSTAPYGYHRIDHNHFADKPEGDGNGYETLKVASGAYSDLDGHVIAEYNYFYRCSGEAEIISNKCYNNIYRYNTFVECKGSVTMRQGMYCMVQGNYFFGNNVSGTGGIRITQRGHKIINNYFQDLGGTGGRSAFYLHAGIDHSEYVVGLGGHVRADSMLIAHNTIVNCAAGIHSGAGDIDDPYYLPSKDNVIANNIITMDDMAPCYIDKSHAGTNQIWQGNLFHGANLGDVPDSGYMVNDPMLALLNDWYQITATSPAVDAGVGEFSDVLEDIDGILRDDHKDIGADELGSGPRQPLTPADVGPAWRRDANLPDEDDLPRILTVTLEGYGTGEVLIDPPGDIYEAGTAVTLTAVPDTGHMFVGWEGDIESTEDSIIVIMDKSITIRAHFDPPLRYTLAVWNMGSGSVEFEPPGGSYAENTMVKVTAIPDDNWGFSQWGGVLSGSNNPDSIMMDSDKSLIATFKELTGIESNQESLTYRLGANYPNPFNPVTTIPFELKKTGYTTLDVYDVLGHKVAELIKGNLDAGSHTVQFDASELTSGVYFYEIRSGDFLAIRKMILMR